jgi:hypothetical protein
LWQLYKGLLEIRGRGKINGIKLKAGGGTKYQCEADKICFQTDAFTTDIRHLILGCVSG